MNPGPMRAQAERLAWWLVVATFVIVAGMSLAMWDLSPVGVP